MSTGGSGKSKEGAGSYPHSSSSLGGEGAGPLSKLLQRTQTKEAGQHFKANLLHR